MVFDLSKLSDSLRRLGSIGVTDEQIDELLNEFSRALIESDVSVKLVKEMKDRIKLALSGAGEKGQNKRKLVQKAVHDELVAMLEPETKPYAVLRRRSNVIMFVGLQGAGKTTTIAKYAGYYAKRGWKVSMVCCDSFRAGAFDQLKQNATKLRVPFYGSYTEADPVVIAEQGTKLFREQNFEIILIDTSGRHRQEGGLFEEMQEIAAVVQPDNTVFVVDGTQGQAVYDQAAGFRDAVDVGSVIVTKLDGHAKGGGALSAVAATQSPVIFLGSGEHFDDFEPFRARTFVRKLLGYGSVKGVAQDSKGDDKDAKKKWKEKYTLRKMYNQLDGMSKAGTLSRMLGMVPGMGGMMGSPFGGMFNGVSADSLFEFLPFLSLPPCLNLLNPPSASPVFFLCAADIHILTATPPHSKPAPRPDGREVQIVQVHDGRDAGR